MKLYTKLVYTCIASTFYTFRAIDHGSLLVSKHLPFLEQSNFSFPSVCIRESVWILLFHSFFKCVNLVLMVFVYCYNIQSVWWLFINISESWNILWLCYRTNRIPCSCTVSCISTSFSNYCLFNFVICQMFNFCLFWKLFVISVRQRYLIYSTCRYVKINSVVPRSIRFL
jgi:hypothetical protein